MMIAAALVVPACAGAIKVQPPSSLVGPGVTAYYANEAAIVIGGVQHTAIGLNGIKLCSPVTPPAPPSCRPLLSDDDTRIVIDIVADTVTTLEKTPAGWLPTVQAALERLQLRLSAYGQTKLVPYLQAARGIILSWVSP